jgi:hypothetical protein
MSSPAACLPTRFPVGTRYVIEGRAGRIQLRYLEFPDGRRVDMPADGPDCSRTRATRTSRRRSRTQSRRKS